MNVHLHIWRYNAAMPASEQPWIVSIVVDGVALEEPPCFETWIEAVQYACP